MPKVPPVPVHEAGLMPSVLSVPVHDLTAAEVEMGLPDNEPVISMTLEAKGIGHPVVFALSPAAAAQLARALRKTVKDYLRHVPETE